MNPAAFLHKQLSYFVGTTDGRRSFLFRPPSPASPMFLHERAQIILRRTEVLAWTFMILVVLWILVDVLVFPPEMVDALIVGRVAAATCLGVLLIVSLALVRRATWLTSYLTLLGLVAIPSLFALYAQPSFDAWRHGGGTTSQLQLAAMSLYRQLPLIYISGLALFPMTLLESLPIALSIAAMALAADMGGAGLGAVRADQWAALWVLLVTGGAALLAGVLQFNLLWQSHRLQDYDAETGLMKRAAALDLLQLYWHERGHQTRPMTIGVIAAPVPVGSEAELRHGTGNGPLARMASRLQQPLPRGIQAVRWSNSRLGLLAIDADPATLEEVLGRVCVEGKSNPEQQPGFAIAERLSDHSVSPLNLLNMAEQKLRHHTAPAWHAADG
jgi:GGDEF domain-containing protein